MCIKLWEENHGRQFVSVYIAFVELKTLIHDFTMLTLHAHIQYILLGVQVEIVSIRILERLTTLKPKLMIKLLFTVKLCRSARINKNSSNINPAR